MKKLAAIHPGPPRHWVGDGFHVRSIFSYDGWGRELSPFLLLDYAEPAYFSPSEQPRGVGVHPHRGFETVTIVYQGSLAHRDSSGGGGQIGPGDVQWMTAGAGLVHEEFHSPEFTREGGTMEMVQLWVNLPAKHKKAPPGYQAILDKDIPVVEVDHAGTIRVIAGEFRGTRGPAKTFTPVNLGDVRATAGGKMTLPLPNGHTTALLILRGAVNLEGKKAKAGELAVFSREGEDIQIEATEDSTLLVLNGEPINEPVAGMGPFVMNTREEILRAIEDFQSGKMGNIGP